MNHSKREKKGKSHKSQSQAIVKESEMVSICINQYLVSCDSSQPFMYSTIHIHYAMKEKMRGMNRDCD